MTTQTYKMLKTLYIVLSALLLCSCNNRSQIKMPGQLVKIMSEYINTHSDDSLFTMAITKIKDKPVLIIDKANCYDSNYVDNVFKFKERTVVIYCLYNYKTESLLQNLQGNKNMELLSQFRQCDNMDDGYDGRECKIHTIDKNGTLVDFHPNNGKKQELPDIPYIRSKALKKLLYEHLNRTNDPIIYLRFNSIGNDNYVCIGSDFVYCDSLYMASFLHNGRTIAIYSSNKDKNCDLVDLNQAKKAKTDIKKYKQIIRNFPIRPEFKYRVTLDETLEEVDAPNPLFMDI